jgi:hypothetical protein
MKRILIVFILLLACLGCSPVIRCDKTQGEKACTQILFIGNSYTYMNDLPDTFSELSSAGGHTVEAGISAQGGWALSDHVNSEDTQKQISSSKWDFVVLQEQSQIPAVPFSRTEMMYPAARILVHKIENAGATPIFFLA